MLCRAPAALTPWSWRNRRRTFRSAACEDLMTHSDLLGVVPQQALLDGAAKGQVMPLRLTRGASALRDASVHADTIAPASRDRHRRVAATSCSLDLQERSDRCPPKVVPSRPTGIRGVSQRRKRVPVGQVRHAAAPEHVVVAPRLRSRSMTLVALDLQRESGQPRRSATMRPQGAPTSRCGG